MDTSILFKGMVEQDKEWSKTALKLHKIKRELKALKLIEDELTKELIEKSNGSDSHDKRLTFMQFERKGSINYKVIPQLQNIDLEPFRKASCSYWKLDLVK